MVRVTTAYVCATCGVQFAPSEQPPPECPICVDERQYIARGGQRWTTPDELRAGHTVVVREDEGVLGVGTEPGFAIGQRALLVPLPDGTNLMWDCTSVLTDEGVAAIQEHGGVSVIAISHPHYHGAMVDWARALDATIRLSSADRIWVMRPDDRIEFWDGDALELAPGITLLRLGGHFAGATVAHWAAGAEGRGELLAGDVISVAQDRRWATFMRSYPNYIPLPEAVVSGMVQQLEPYAFDRLHGAWFGQVIASDAKAAVRRSADRYIRALHGEMPGRDG